MAWVLQHAVMWRNGAGTESKMCSHFVENVLTIVATCRQLSRNVLEYLTGCYTALEGTPPASLLSAVAGVPTT